jgi:hypothetical protein
VSGTLRAADDFKELKDLEEGANDAIAKAGCGSGARRGGFHFRRPGCRAPWLELYGAAKVIKTEGPVEVVRYQNPHGEIEITYEGKRWLVILAPPSRMQARGLPKEDLTVGTVVTVEGYPKRNGEAEMRAERITVKGKTIELR